MLGRSQWPKADSQARQWLGLWVLALLVAASSSLLLRLISSNLHDESSRQSLLFSFLCLLDLTSYHVLGSVVLYL